MAKRKSENGGAAVGKKPKAQGEMLGNVLMEDKDGWGEFYNNILKTNLVPDYLIRMMIRQLNAQRRQEYYDLPMEKQMEHKMNFVKELKSLPLAIKTADANEQHYEVPAEFFNLTLGKRLKYSCGYYPDSNTTLDEAEEAMLALYCQRAQIVDGMTILDLGCGWGSFGLYAAEHFPNSKVISLSNSNGQRGYIEEQAKAKGFKNITVYTGDINSFKMPSGLEFDRIVTIEMFEHMKNYDALFEKIHGWLAPGGKVFIHIFCHREYPYHFEGDHWMAKYFFSGGTMPSEDLFLHFQNKLKIEQHWRVNGQHYGKTCRDWLRLTDKHKKRVLELFAETYGEKEKLKWFVMWRVFYMACEELFNHDGGNEWYVSHYLFTRD
jgi:cyclopropane-fatty-acyl-phospholipid synthase